MTALELLQDPALSQSMTVGQKLIAGSQVAVLGMGIVFFILILLMFVLKMMKKFLYEEFEVKEEAHSITKINKSKMATTDSVDEYEEEIVASIMAALRHHIDQSSGGYKIRSIKRTGGDNVPIWGKMARGGINNNNLVKVFKEVDHE